MIEPQAAATVMIARDSARGIEVFLVRRSARSAFMPDVFVFPGGRVDTDDRSPAAREQMCGALPPIDPAYVYAAARETFEEAGVLFANTGLNSAALAQARRQLLDRTRTFGQILISLDTAVDAGALRYFSHWITPPGESRRFDTYFFVARAPAGQIAHADLSETHDGIWLAPAEALARHAAGAFALIFPTIKHLERLRTFADVAALLDYAAHKTIRAVMPDPGAGKQFVLPPALDGVW
jgi:8-oxo-dGTP pyrophosphatase MutT (NUDIX family)